MLILSNVLSKASGSVNGLTASHNKGGMYFRQRSTPTNPATAFQQAVRNAVGTLSGRWSNVLTQAQRDAWGVYASNQPLLNVFGESKPVTPLDQYIRSNVPRIQAAATIVDAGPTTFTLPSFTEPTAAIVGSTGAVDVTFENSDGWANETGGHLLVYISRPQSVGINYFKGPYRFLGKVDGDGTTAPTSPASFTSPFLGAAGNKYFFQYRVSLADGRLSTVLRNDATAT